MDIMHIQLGPSIPFDLDLTLCCGQAFRWEKRDEWWYGTVRDRVLRIRQNGENLEFEGADTAFIREYFGLQDDLPRIYQQINRDHHIEMAIEKSSGLRILRQDPWECLISYISATYKNIPAIKRMLLRLSEKHGRKIVFDSSSFFTFPTLTSLAKATVKDLRKCELGYRAEFVSQTARKISESDVNLSSLKEMTHEDAKKLLLQYPGVGQKVADCVLLFSLGKLEAFPVDVWIKRAILQHYASHFERKLIRKTNKNEALSDSDYRRLNLFGRDYFGKYAGYAQEYLYHYERMLKKMTSI